MAESCHFESVGPFHLGTPLATGPESCRDLSAQFEGGRRQDRGHRAFARRRTARPPRVDSVLIRPRVEIKDPDLPPREEDNCLDTLDRRV